MILQNLECRLYNIAYFLEDFFFPLLVEGLILKKQHAPFLIQDNAQTCRSFLRGKTLLLSYLKQRSFAT